MKMTYFELKKIFSKPGNKIALILLAVTLCIASSFAIGDVFYVDENGERSTGITAASPLRKAKNEWAGYITEDVLRKVLEENALINNSEEYLSTDIIENEKAFSKKQGFRDIRELINLAYCGFQEYNYFRADSVTQEEIRSFYGRRTATLTEWLNSNEQEGRFSEREKQFLIAQYEKLETPFYYEYADGWKELLAYAPTIIMLVMLITAFLVSGIFSDEIQLKADSIFFSARFGRNKAVAAKIKAGFIAVTVIYWTMILLYSGVVLAVLGTGGANRAIQISSANWKSFYNITFLQDYLLTVLGGYLGNLFILFLSMLVSAKTHSKALAVTIPFILLFIPSFLSGISVLSEILGLLPDQLLQVCNAVKTFNLYQLGTKVIGAVPIIFIMYFILFCILLPILYLVYQKTEIK
ncbi:MAG: ABC transporter permease [Eubacteriales bacterium]|nr:ABC transporter permease [Eubacteriales bacterium]